jgi:Septum formation
MSVPACRALAAVGVVGVLVLTGCSGGSTGAAARPKAAAPSVSARPSAAPVIAVPHVGECWNSTPALAKPFSWTGSAVVSCAAKHTAVTFAVGTVPTAFDYAKVAHDGDDYGDARAMGAKKPCSYLNALKYVGHNYETPLRLRVTWYGPTATQYAAGARWFRCDLQVTDGKGFRVLAKNLQHSINVGGRLYAYCDTGKRGSTVGECTKASVWLVTRVVDAATNASAAFPGKTAVTARADKVCRLNGVAWARSSPTNAKMWSHSTLIWCWKAI